MEMFRMLVTWTGMLEGEHLDERLHCWGMACCMYVDSMDPTWRLLASVWGTWRGEAEKKKLVSGSWSQLVDGSWFWLENAILFRLVVAGSLSLPCPAVL